jgi:hypothetical protein
LTVNVGNEISLEEQMNLICIYLYGKNMKALAMVIFLLHQNEMLIFAVFTSLYLP